MFCEHSVLYHHAGHDFVSNFLVLSEILEAGCDLCLFGFSFFQCELFWRKHNPHPLTAPCLPASEPVWIRPYFLGNAASASKGAYPSHITVS